MREIKFRAWDKNHNEMSRVTSINFDEKYIRGLIEVGGNLDIESSYNFSDIELMQHIDLEDCNGVEIYEGDLLNCWYKVGKKVIVKVVYNEKYAQFEYKCIHFGLLRFKPGEVYKVEVIGNIHENPELMEG